MSAPTETSRIAPLRGVRRLVAQRMMESLQQSAQLTYHGFADVSARVAKRREGDRGSSVEDWALWALARALTAQPEANAVLSAEHALIAPRVHVGIAIQTPQGLVTPVLRDAASKTLAEIAAARTQLVQQAREGRLSVSDMKGSTTTLSNLGHLPVTWFTPILNGGQAILLGLGRREARVDLDDANRPRSRQLLPLSLTADHRWIDGEPAGRLLGAICDALAGTEEGAATR